MRTPIRAALLALSLQLPAAADVLIVDPAGSLGYLQIQSAIEAAADGDVILVRTGIYAGFSLHQRSLAVLADVNAEVEIDGAVFVTETPLDGVVLLGGIQLQGKFLSSGLPGQTALTIADNIGFVRLEDCTLEGGWGAYVSCFVSTPGGAGCSIENSAKVALAGCTLIGGPGGGDPYATCLGGVGGHGLRTETSGVVLYDCSVTGGLGGTADIYPGQQGGPGGVACEVVDFGLFASNTLLRGGSGGYGHAGGNGGVGLLVQAAAQAQLLECQILGGPAGIGDGGPDGVAGQPTSGGGVISFLPGKARRLSAPTIAADTGKLSVKVEGEPGDEVWILRSKAPAHVFAPNLSGVWLVGRPVFLPKAPMTVLGASGQATLELGLPDLPLGTPERTFFLQGLVDGAGGETILGSPMHATVLDCEALLPDCNGSGSFDSCDLLAGGSQDCNGNSIPDECDADCNHNGIADPCDIAGGTSQDLNHNAIPDECEPQGLTWYVDAAAPPGGNGSPASPFRSIGEAIAPSLSGYTILVRDGLYTGPANRNLSFGGRDLVVESLNGPAACILDCQDLGSGFFIQNGESAASRIAGFTIRNGKTFSWGGGIRLHASHTAIRDCVFVDCNASEGGGVDLSSSSAEIADCLFVGNLAEHGAGLSIHGTAQGVAPRVSWCTFVDNFAVGGYGGEGGGIYVGSVGGILLSHLTLIGNQSSKWGGGILIQSGAAAIDHCLIAGNSAPLGSSIHSRSANVYLRDLTLADNLASTQASIYATNTNLQRDLRLTNCVVWDDPAANGPLVEAATSLISLSVERCDLRGGQASVVVAPGSSLLYGPGNLDLDPLFADPDGPDNDPLTLLDNDYRLGALSACADAGDNGLVLPDYLDLDGDGNTTEPTPYDLDGHPRFVDDPAVPDTGAGTPPLVDLGAFERQ